MRTLRLTSQLRGHGAGSHPLGESDVFVGIYWQSYGWTASPTTVSGIEDEYRQGGDLPQLVYVKEPAPGREPALTRLLSQIGNDGKASRRASRRLASWRSCCSTTWRR